MAADNVRQRLEELAHDLHVLHAKKIFSKEEIRDIVRHRTDHEYKISHVCPDITECRDILAYEKGLEVVRRQRSEGRPWHRAEGHFINRTKALYRRFCQRLREEQRLQIMREYLTYLTGLHRKGTKREAGRLLDTMMSEHPTNCEVWIAAAQWEMRENKSIDNPRAILQRGLRVMDTSARLWCAYFEIEVVYWGQLLQKLQGHESEGGVPENMTKVLGGSIPMVVHRSAMQKLNPAECVPTTVDMLDRCGRHKFTAGLMRHLGEWLRSQAEAGAAGAALATAAADSVPFRCVAGGIVSASKHVGGGVLPPDDADEEVEPGTDQERAAQLLQAAFDTHLAAPGDSAAGDAVLWLADTAVRVAYDLPRKARLPGSLAAVSDIGHPSVSCAVAALQRLAVSGWPLSEDAASRVAALVRQRGDHASAAAVLRNTAERTGSGKLWAAFAAAACAAADGKQEEVVEEAIRGAGATPAAAPLWVALIQLAAAHAPLRPDDSAVPAGSDSDSDSSDSGVARKQSQQQPTHLLSVCKRATSAMAALGLAQHGQARQEALTQVLRCVRAAVADAVPLLLTVPRLPEAVAVECVDDVIAAAADPPAKRRRLAAPGASTNAVRPLFHRLLFGPSGLGKSAALWARWIDYELRNGEVPRANQLRQQASRSGVSAADMEAVAVAALQLR